MANQTARSFQALWTLAALGLLSPALARQEPGSPDDPIAETVEATVLTIPFVARDTEGNPVTDLSPSEVIVIEAGVERPVVSIAPRWRRPASTPLSSPEVTADEIEGPEVTTEPVAVEADQPPANPDGQVLIYVDGVLSSRRGVSQALELLAERCETLHGLGRVDLVIADPAPKLYSSTQDPEATRSVLARIAASPPGQEAHIRLRRNYVRAVEQEHLDDMLGVIPGGGQGGGGAGPPTPGGPGVPGGGRGLQPEDPRSTIRRTNRGGEARGQRMLAAATAREEHQLIERQHQALMSWITATDRGTPGVLFLVGDGYDTNPRDFYLATSHQSSVTSEIAADLRALDSTAAVSELARFLAASGWVVYPVGLGDLQATQTTEASESGRARSRAFSRNRGIDSNLTAFTLHHPFEPLRDIADRTGGVVATSSAELEHEIQGLSRGMLLSYQVGREPDGVAREIALRTTRPGVTLSAPKLAATATSDELAGRRARRALAGAIDLGDLAVTLDATVPATGGDGHLDLVVQNLGSLMAAAGASSPRVRITLGILLPDSRAFVRAFPPQQLEPHTTEWHYRVPVRVPANTQSFAIVVDELGSGAWGVGAASLQPSITP